MYLQAEQWPPSVMTGTNAGSNRLQQHHNQQHTHTPDMWRPVRQSKAIHLFSEVNGCLTEKGFNHIAAELYAASGSCCSSLLLCLRPEELTVGF